MDNYYIPSENITEYFLLIVKVMESVASIACVNLVLVLEIL